MRHQHWLSVISITNAFQNIYQTSIKASIKLKGLKVVLLEYKNAASFSYEAALAALHSELKRIYFVCETS